MKRHIYFLCMVLPFLMIILHPIGALCEEIIVPNFEDITYEQLIIQFGKQWKGNRIYQYALNVTYGDIEHEGETLTGYGSKRYLTKHPAEEQYELYIFADANATLTRIGAHAFDGLTIEDLYLTIGEGFEVIEQGAFTQQNMTLLSLPSTANGIEAGAFTECAFLRVVQYGNGITTLGSKTFVNCDSLQVVIIPRSATQIADDFIYSDSITGMNHITIYGYNGSEGAPVRCR